MKAAVTPLALARPGRRLPQIAGKEEGAVPPHHSDRHAGLTETAAAVVLTPARIAAVVAEDPDGLLTPPVTPQNVVMGGLRLRLTAVAAWPDVERERPA